MFHKSNQPAIFAALPTTDVSFNPNCEEEMSDVSPDAARHHTQHHRYVMRLRKKMREMGVFSEWGARCLIWKHPTKPANVAIFDHADDFYFTVQKVRLREGGVVRFTIKADTSTELIAKLKKFELLPAIIS
jgi:hypothetical protein